MKTELVLLVILVGIGVTQPGCAALWTGAGTAGAATAYEAHNKYELDKLNRDYESGRISKEEYDARKSQVKKDSVVY